MKQQLRHDLWVCAAVLVVGAVFGGLAYWLCLPKSDETAIVAPPRVQTPAVLHSPHDVAKAAQSVALATISPTKPLALPTPVSILPGGKPPEVLPATISKGPDDTPALKLSSMIATGPSQPALTAEGVRKAAATVPLAVLETNRVMVYLVSGVPMPAPPEPIWDTDRIPTDPLSLIWSFGAEPLLIDWLAAWKDGICQDHPRTAEQLNELEGLLATTSLNCTQLYEIGHGVKYVEGMAGAAPFYRAAVGKAELELQNHPPEDPNDMVVIHALAQMGVWLPFSERVYPTLVRIFQLIRDHTQPHTGLYYRAEILLANSLYEVGRGLDKSSNLKAATIYKSMLEQPDVQQWPKTALTSLHWGLGSALYQGDQFAEAAPHFQAAGELDSQSYAGWARQFYVAALAKAGQIEDAKREYAIWVAESKPTPGNADHISRTIALMEQKYPVKKVEKESAGSPHQIDTPNVDADH